MTNTRSSGEAFPVRAGMREKLDDEIQTRSDANTLVLNDLQPFVRRLLGSDEVPTGKNYNFSFDTKDPTGKLVNYEVAEVRFAQELGKKSLRGVVFEIEHSEVEMFMVPPDDATWEVVKTNINRAYFNEYEETLVPEDAAYFDYDEVSPFMSLLLTLQYGCRPRKVLSYGYRVTQGHEDLWVIAQPTAIQVDLDERFNASLVEAQTLVALEDQYERQLTPEDVEKFYRVLHCFGHRPARRAHVKTTPVPKF